MSHFVYILGNLPFIEARNKTPEQAAECAVTRDALPYPMAASTMVTVTRDA